MNKVTITLAMGIALVVLAVAVTLTRAPPRVVRAVGQEQVGRGEHRKLGLTTSDIAICQAEKCCRPAIGDSHLAAGVLRARVQVVAYSGSTVLAEGRRGADWTAIGHVPVQPLARSSTAVKLCFAIGPNSEPVAILGALRPPGSGRWPTSHRLTPAAATIAGVLLGGRVGLEYLAAGRGSWWSRTPPVAWHMGLGRAISGTWIVLFVAALMAAAGVLAVRLALRELP